MKPILILLLLLVACSKPVPVVVKVDPIVVVRAKEEQPKASKDADKAVPKVSPPTQVGVRVIVVVKPMTPRHSRQDHAEAAAYKKAYANAVLANSLLGRHAFRTHA